MCAQQVLGGEGGGGQAEGKTECGVGEGRAQHGRGMRVEEQKRTDRPWQGAG